MNDEFSTDSVFQSLEARLMAHRPMLPDCERRALYYECAFAAGKNSAIRGTRRWQVASVALAVLLLGLSIPLVHERLLVVRPEPAANRPARAAHAAAPGHFSASWSHIASVPLDAWQVQDNTETKFETELAKFQQMNASSRSYAVGTWMRAGATVP
jgi:hypothetical protein